MSNKRLIFPPDDLPHGVVTAKIRALVLNPTLSAAQEYRYLLTAIAGVVKGKEMSDENVTQVQAFTDKWLGGDAKAQTILLKLLAADITGADPLSVTQYRVRRSVGQEEVLNPTIEYEQGNVPSARRQLEKHHWTESRKIA